MGCQRKHPLHTSLGSLLLSCGILLSSVGWIQLHKSHRRPSFIVQCAWFQAATQLSWLPVLISVAPPSLRRKASTGIMLQIIEAHPNWPVYADVFKHHLHGLHLDAQYGQTQLCRHNYAAERTGRRLLWSLVNHTVVTDPTNRQPGFDLPRYAWSLMNHFRTGQGPCRTNLHEWGLVQSSACDCGQRQTMNHIVDLCPLTKFEGGLNLLHKADDDAVIWLASTMTAALAK